MLALPDPSLPGLLPVQTISQLGLRGSSKHREEPQPERRISVLGSAYPDSVLAAALCNFFPFLLQLSELSAVLPPAKVPAPFKSL